jgi:hypothetical protein
MLVATIDRYISAHKQHQENGSKGGKAKAENQKRSYNIENYNEKALKDDLHYESRKKKEPENK